MEGEGGEGGAVGAHMPGPGMLSPASGTCPPSSLSDFLQLEPGKQIPENLP